MDAASRPRVVVVGTGFAGLEAAFYVRKRLGKRVELTLVGEQAAFFFKPGTIYIPFGKPPEAYVFPLEPTLEKRHVPFVKGRVTRVDPVERTIRAGDQVVPYDTLFLATGARTRADEIPGLAEHAISIWTPADMLRVRAALEGVMARVGAGKASRIRFLVPPGNACSGPIYELVMMLDTWLGRHAARELVDLACFTHETGYLEPLGPRLNVVLEEELDRRDITGRRGAVVERVERGAICFGDGSRETFDVLIALPPQVASTRLEGLPQDARGFLTTDPRTMQVVGQPDIYAIGDAADFPVKQAFLALLQADAAAEHACERILGEDPRASFDPVSLCILEQLDQATFAQVPLRRTGDPHRPVAVREQDVDLYRVGSGMIWRMAKKMLGAAIPQRFTRGQPFHAGASWAVLDAGVKVMSSVLSD